MLDTKEIIEDLEAINRRAGFTFTGVVNAIKVVKMWERLSIEYGGLIIKFPSHQKVVREYMNEIEEEFFPSIIHQTVKVAIQGINKQRLRNTIETIKCVEGVDEVRQ